jgi:hypothetical protein
MIEPQLRIPLSIILNLIRLTRYSHICMPGHLRHLILDASHQPFVLIALDHVVQKDGRSQQRFSVDIDGMATIDQDARSLFGLLPPGIRDQIYDATLFQDIQREHLHFRFKAPCPHLRLVSRQFRDEYDRRPIWGTTLEVSFLADLSELGYPGTPGLAARCTSLQLNYLFQRDLHAHEFMPYGFAIACCQVTLHLVPRRLQNLNVHLIWNSVRMLKDYLSSEVSNRLHGYIDRMVWNQYSCLHGATRRRMREDISNPGVSHLKLHYGGISLSDSSMRSKCDALGAELLKQPVTLDVWSGKDNCYLLDEDGISERLRLETLVEAATKVHVKDQSSGDAEINISEEPIWQEEVDFEVKNGIEWQ